jgi:NAD(P)-dependent dehydrogenase (short-subunit alcohol dehydrogenase family)
VHLKKNCAAVAKTIEALGGLDIFVSNAGILTMGPIDTYSLEDLTEWWPSTSVPPSSEFRHPLET